MKIFFIKLLIVLSVILTGCNNINQHIHIACEECGKCIAEDCNGLEEEKCQGHQIVHTHTECEECGKCLAEDCNGLEEEKCQGCVIINLSDKIYVSHLFNEKAYGGIEKFIIESYEQYVDFVNKNSLMEIKFGSKEGSIYDDKYYSVLNNYDKEFFKKNSLILFMIGHYHSRENPCIVYKVEYLEHTLIVNITITFDDYPINFQGSLFFNVEVSKFVINNYKQIEYTANKIVVYD